MYFTSGNYVDTFSFPSFTIPNYYNSIDFNLTGDSLENVLRSLIISTHLTDLPYTSTNYDTWDLIKSSDLNPGDSNNVILVYGYDDNDTNIENDRLRRKILHVILVHVMDYGQECIPKINCKSKYVNKHGYWNRRS